MSGVDFNGSFGYNVRNYQMMQKAKFGAGVRGMQMGQMNSLYSMNSSLFKLDDSLTSQNLFSTNKASNNFNFNGVQYDNAFAMLNSVNGDSQGGKAEGKSFADKVVDFVHKAGDFGKKAIGSVKSFFGKIAGKAGEKGKASEVGKALEDINNAQDKETLTKALDGAKGEQVANAKKGEASEKALQKSEKDAAAAKKEAESSETKLEKDKSQLENDKSALEQAKSEVKNAESGLAKAQQNTASAEQNLSAAKAAATPENPNTAAIQNAEAELNAAKQQEEVAKKQLEEAKQKETQAQQSVDKSTEQVNTSETENKKAQEGAKAAEEKVQVAEQESTAIKNDGKQIDEGIEDGNKKLEQMNNTEAPTNLDGTPVASDPNAPAQNGAQVSADPNANANSSVAPQTQSNNIYEQNGNYYVNGYQVDQNMYNAAKSMDQEVLNAGFSPGSTSDVYMNGADEPKTFTVSEGKYFVDGQEVDSQVFLAEYNNAKANEESGMDGGITLINDDYSKYGNQSTQNTANSGEVKTAKNNTNDKKQVSTKSKVAQDAVVKNNNQVVNQPTQADKNSSASLPSSDNPTVDFQNRELNSMMDTNNLTPEQRQEVLDNYNKVNNLKPGESVNINGREYAMDAEGKVTVDGRDSVSVDGKNDVRGYAASAADSTIRKSASANKQKSVDNLAAEYNELKSKPNPTPEDKTKMKQIMNQAGNIAGSDPRISFDKFKK